LAGGQRRGKAAVGVADKCVDVEFLMLSPSPPLTPCISLQSTCSSSALYSSPSLVSWRALF
jgi:hypothetical protein